MTLDYDYKNIDDAEPANETPVAIAIAEGYASYSSEACLTSSSALSAEGSSIEIMMSPSDTMSFGRKPFHMVVCPECAEANVLTKTRSFPAFGTWVLVALGAVFCLPCCWIPLVVDPMKQTDHYCQRCLAKVGEIGPLEDCCVKER